MAPSGLILMKLSGGFVLKCVCDFRKGKNRQGWLSFCDTVYGSLPVGLKKKLVSWSFEKVILAHRLPVTLE